MRLHGKRHKRDRYYFRWHYGKQRMVYITKQYTDRPTENQKVSRNTFTTIRKEVSRQLHDPILKARWQAKFQADPQGYKFLHTYVYAQLKAGVTVLVETRIKDLSTPCAGSELPILIVHNGVIVPVFLPWKVPKREYWQIE